jgi:hypothetical protein
LFLPLTFKYSICINEIMKTFSLYIYSGEFQSFASECKDVFRQKPSICLFTCK